MFSVCHISIKKNEMLCLYYIYYCQKVKCCIDATMNSILQKHKMDWSEKIKNKPKLRTYRLYKCDFSAEKYLYLNLPKWKRSILAQFRLGILPLNIETGRYKVIKDSAGNYRKQKPEERLCTLCSTNATEDEIHFLLDCPCYDPIRQDLFNSVTLKNENFLNLPKLEQFKYLMESCANLVAKYLCTSWDKRKHMLYNNAET